MRKARKEGTSLAGWWVLVGCLVCQTGLGLGGYVFAVFLKPVVTELGWTRTGFSFSTLPLLLAMSLGSPLVGTLTDRLGPRFVFTTSITLAAVALCLFSVMTRLWELYAIGFLLGVAVTGLGDIPTGAVVSQWFVRNRGLALGLVYVGSNIGGTIVPIVASEIAEISSWRVALRVLAAGGWLLIVPFALWVARAKPEDVDPVDQGRSCVSRHSLPGESRTRARKGERRETQERPLPLATAVRTPTFWRLAVALFLFYFYYLAVNQHLVAFLSDSGFSDAEAGRRFGAAVAVGVVGKIGMGWLADRMQQKTAILLTFGLMTVASFLLLGVGWIPALLPAFLVLHGLTVAAENVVFPLVVADCFGVRHLARIYGALMLALLPGGVLGPVFAGRVHDTAGSYGTAFATFAILNVVGWIVLCGIRRECALEARPAEPG